MVKKRHYSAVKSFSVLLRGITWKHDGCFYCLNCFHSYIKNENLKNHEKICKNYDHCHVKMPNKDNQILKYKHGEKSMKIPFITDADLESLL